MRIRRPWLLWVVVLLTPATAHAHDHFADLFAGVSFVFASTHPGVHLSFSKTVPEAPSTAAGVKTVTFVGDFSAHAGDDSHGRQIIYMAGLRYTFARTPSQKRLPFVHALIGGAHTKTGGQGDADPALLVGGGFEYVLKDSPRGLGLRVQADYIVRGGDVEPRVSAGIVWRR